MTLSARRDCRAIPFFGTFLLLCLGVGCNRKPAPAVEEEVQSAPVVAVPAQMLSLSERTELVGSTAPLPNRAARVTANVEGRILWVLGDVSGKTLVEGQRVERGQVVVQLDDRLA